MATSLIGKVLTVLGLRKPSVFRHRTLGDQARDARDWPQAVQHYRTYLAARPEDFAIWVQLGHTAKEMGDAAGAEQAYLRAEGLNPRDGDLLLNLGHFMKGQRRWIEARSFFRRSYASSGIGEALVEAERIEEEQNIPADAPLVGLAGTGAADGLVDGRLIGVVDRVLPGEIRGWAIEPDDAGQPAEIEAVAQDGRVIGRTVASIDRPDVGATGKNTSIAGFSLFVDAEDLGAGSTAVGVRLRSTGQALKGSPVTLPIHPTGMTPGQDRVTEARYVIAKRLRHVGGEHALVVAYAATGMLQPFVRRYIAMWKAAGVAVTLVVNADRPVLLDDETLALVDSAIVRENRGYDFGAWAHALHIEPALYGAETLYIVNDSVLGPRDAASFERIVADVRASVADLVGLTETLERGWHIQSYFMAVKRRLLASYAFQFFVGDIRVVTDKDRIIDQYEVPLARRVRAAGFEAAALFPIDEARNPTLFAWRALLERGFPFVKLNLLRGGFPQIDTSGIRRALTEAGFDKALVRATLAYGTDEKPAAKGYPLLAKPPLVSVDEPELPAKPFKVAFYGPWNYDNGLGSASRGIIAAIRQTGVRLNLHPIKLPFHIHKPLAPAFDIVDFDGPADIAIVHLNPDSWHLLTDEQRAAVRAAGKRIGYWVWEMSHLPPLWRREFSSVDRIWAPSGYCAEVFAAEDEAPVDVVPHAVPVDRAVQAGVDRDRVLRSIDVDPGRRVILYVFDGSSYLVRKNPAALVRAFGRTGLAAQGWTLVLKTKHLMDRAEEGAALATLAAATPGVLLLDRSLSTGELGDLLDAADIYASPHSSEGFGLTVAEAMAAGKAVVATDFSGTRQFLDASCGYPVAAERWTLEEDFGHYAKGGTWARIDEAALAGSLSQAAARIAAGDDSMGAAARARIAERLSLKTVGRAIARSFDAVVADHRPIRRAPARIDSGSEAGIPIDLVGLGDALAVLPLAAGGLTPPGDGLDRVADDAGRWLMLVPKDARLHPLTHRILARHASPRPDVAIFYADDVALAGATLLEQVRLKPEFDRVLFAAQDYVGAPLFVRGSALHALGGLDPAKGEAALYDLVLRAAERGYSVARLPEVLLIQPEARPVAPVEERARLLAASPLYANYKISPGRTPETLALQARFAGGEPAVTLCIPTRQTATGDGGGTFIERFLESVATVDWPADRLMVLVGDDVAGAPPWATRAWPFALKRIETLRGPDEPFNYSAKMNLLWRAAETDLVVLMNDDVVARDDGWLRALAGLAVDGAIGGVGARLLYDDGTIQHAGIVGGLFGTSVHAWLGRKPGARTYQDWAEVQREWSMVTGAVFATRRGVLEAVGGFDEDFSLEFNDVDLCLKIRAAGWRILCNPMAEMTHSEKQSRGETAPPGEQVARFLSRWQDWLRDDPAFHPRMRRDLIDLAPATQDAWFA